MAPLRVHKVPRWEAAAQPGNAVVPAAYPSPSYTIFALDGFEDEAEADPINESAIKTAETVRRLTTADDAQVRAAAAGDGGRPACACQRASHACPAPRPQTRWCPPPECTA